jgi:transposase-like protein
VGVLPASPSRRPAWRRRRSSPTGHRCIRKLLDELFPKAWHHSEQYANNPIEADHGQLKRRLRPMRHLRNDRTATVVITGHAFVQNLRRDHYRLTTGVPTNLRLVAAFDELTHAI